MPEEINTISYMTGINEMFQDYMNLQNPTTQQTHEINWRLRSSIQTLETSIKNYQDLIRRTPEITKIPQGIQVHKDIDEEIARVEKNILVIQTMRSQIKKLTMIERLRYLFSKKE